MKTKTIEKAIKNKIAAWANSVSDPVVADTIKNKTMVSGGAIASMLLKEQVNDFDIYFSTPEASLTVGYYYVQEMIKSQNMHINPRLLFIFADGSEETYSICPDDTDEQCKLFNSSNPPTGFIRYEVYIKSAGFVADGIDDNKYEFFESTAPEKADDYINQEDVSDDGKPAYRPIFISSNAITLSNRIQLILRFTGTPEEVHKNFDFVHATNYWSEKTGLVLNLDALASILAKDLQYVGSLFPLASIFRTRKFIQRGWSCHVGNYLKMAVQLNDLELKNLSVLKEQLTGMDAAYLSQVIKAIENGKSENGAEITTTYLMTLIERLMGESL